MAKRKSIFSSMKNAKVRIDANYVKQGQYYFLITKCKIDENRKHEKFCAVEMTCVHVIDGDNGAGHIAGEDVSWLIMVSNEYFGSDILAFICNVMGMDPEELDEDERIEAAEMVFSEEDDKEHEQPLAGTTVEVKARNVQLKDNKGTFTKVAFLRQVPASELSKKLDDKAKDRFYPNNVLSQMESDEDS